MVWLGLSVRKLLMVLAISDESPIALATLTLCFLLRWVKDSRLLIRIATCRSDCLTRLTDLLVCLKVLGTLCRTPHSLVQLRTVVNGACSLRSVLEMKCPTPLAALLRLRKSDLTWASTEPSEVVRELILAPLGVEGTCRSRLLVVTPVVAPLTCPSGATARRTTSADRELLSSIMVTLIIT